MTDSNTIEIKLSKTKLAKLLFFSCLFVAGGLWLILANPHTSNPMFNNTIVKTLAAYGATIMGLLGVYFFTKKLFDKEPGLTLNEQGIYDNTSAFKFGFIPWSDISEVYERTVQASVASKQRFVTISLVNPDKYISRESNILKKKLLQLNAKSYGSPVHISANGLQTNHNDLLNLIDSYFEKYRQAV